MTSSQESTWRSFLGGGEAPPTPLESLQKARAEAAAAKEAELAKDQQLELMTAMLQAAEDELKLRSNQLEITNAMLHTTEEELAKKSEQLEITTHMLRKAEEEIREQNRDGTELRKEVASLRKSLSNATRRDAPSTLDIVPTPVADTDRSPAAAASVASAVDATSASVLEDEVSRLNVAASIARTGTRAAGGQASVPSQLPEQQRQGDRSLPPARVALTNADSIESMSRGEWVRDTRASVMDYIGARAQNIRLPTTHTGMYLGQGVMGNAEDVE
jgi:hypothetical protein